MTIMAEELLPLLHPPRIGFVGLGSSNDLALAFGIDGLQRSLTPWPEVVLFPSTSVRLSWR